MYSDIMQNLLSPLNLYKFSGIVGAEINAIGNQFDGVQASIDNLELQSTLQTATEEGIAFREQLYGINPTGLTLEERRTNILAKERGGLGATPSLLQLSLLAYGYDVEIIENFADYSFTVKFVDTLGIPSNIADLQIIIENLKPAHLAISYEYIYNTNNFLSAYTHNELTAYTYEQVRSDNLT